MRIRDWSSDVCSSDLLQGDAITNQPFDVARIALPLVIYFTLMWGGSMLLAHRVGLSYERSTSVAFPAAGNNFDLAIAVAIAVFGVTSGHALAGLLVPPIEYPIIFGHSGRGSWWSRECQYG